MCDYFRREGIDDMRGFQEFCVNHFQKMDSQAQARGLPGPVNQGIGALGRELDSATVSWIVEQAQQETGTNIGIILKDHLEDRISQALNMQRGRSKNEYFVLFPVDQDPGCKGRWAGADDQWTKLWWKTDPSPLADITMAVGNGARGTGIGQGGKGSDAWDDWKKRTLLTPRLTGTIGAA